MGWKPGTWSRQLLLCAVALNLCLCLIGCKSGPPGIQQSWTYERVPVGIGEDYPKASRSLTAARRDLETIKTNGVKVLRISFAWDAMEPERGRFDWSFWDDYVRMAVQEYHLTLIPYVCYTPSWASATQDAFWSQPPQENAFFGEFVRELVTHFKGQIHSWEIWNEPDNPEYWRGSVRQFAELLETGSRAVREADPSAQIVMGGLAWDLGFLEAMLTNQVAIQNVNIFNLHNYYETWSVDPIERIPEYLGRARDILWAHGRRNPLWLAEVGYSSFRRGRFVSPLVAALYDYEHTPGYQAAALFRVLTLALASGKVSLVTWYRINDLPSGEEVIGDENNRHLGVLDKNGQPKPALRALGHFEALFSQGFRCCDGEVLVTRPVSSRAVVHTFLRPDSRLVVIGWLRTLIPGQREEIESAGKKLERIRIIVPFEMVHGGKVFDELGTFTRELETSRSKGGTTFEMELHSAHVEIAVLNKQLRR